MEELQEYTSDVYASHKILLLREVVVTNYIAENKQCDTDLNHRRFEAQIVYKSH